MFCCNLASGTGVLAIVLLARAGVLQVWQIYLGPSAPLVATGLFIVMFGAPIINGSSQARWRTMLSSRCSSRAGGWRTASAPGAASASFT